MKIKLVIYLGLLLLFLIPIYAQSDFQNSNIPSRDNNMVVSYSIFEDIKIKIIESKEEIIADIDTKSEETKQYVDDSYSNIRNEFRFIQAKIFLLIFASNCFGMILGSMIIFLINRRNTKKLTLFNNNNDIYNRPTDVQKIPKPHYKTQSYQSMGEFTEDMTEEDMLRLKELELLNLEIERLKHNGN